MPTRTKSSIIWLLVAAFSVAMFFINPLADIASRFSREVMIGSGALYGTLRIANSVMSVARDADVTGGVGVASVTASPGQLLQPVINTIERMVDLLFYLAIVSGILSLVLVPVAKVAAAGLAVFALICAGLTLAARRVPAAIEKLARAFAVLGLLGAVLLPASYTIAFYAGDAITDEAWLHATDVFERMDVESEAKAVESQVDALKGSLPPAGTAAEQGGIFERFGTAVDASRSALSDTLQAASDMAGSVATNARIINEGVAISTDLFTASIGIAVAYLVKLLVLPILILAAMLYLLRSTTR